MREDREKEEKIEKIVQQFDLKDMEVIKNRTILSMTMCHKKRYIQDYFNRINSDMHMKTSNDKPSLSKLCKIMNKAIPKEDE